MPRTATPRSASREAMRPPGTDIPPRLPCAARVVRHGAGAAVAIAPRGHVRGARARPWTLQGVAPEARGVQHQAGGAAEVTGELLVVVEPPEGRFGEEDESRPSLLQPSELVEGGAVVHRATAAAAVPLEEGQTAPAVGGEPGPPAVLVDQDIRLARWHQAHDLLGHLPE